MTEASETESKAGVVSLHTVEQFGHALKLAEAAAIRMAPVPVTIKVLSVTLREAQRFTGTMA